ncbi:MAG: class I adenylate-forming enzyme family protein [Acetobacteraceae bacterium]
MQVRAGLLASYAGQWYGSTEALTARSATGVTLHQTFGDLNRQCNRLGSGLRALGVARGDRAGVWAHNIPELFPIWLGMEKHNIVRVVLHSHFGMDDHVASLNHVEASAMLFDTRFTEAVAAARNELKTVHHFVAIGKNPPQWATSYADVMAAGKDEEPMLDVDEDSPCFLQLTSGTTGHPKPWVMTYRSWEAVINHNLHHFDSFDPNAPKVGPQDVNLHFHALQWAAGYQTLYPYLIRGARSILLDDEAFDPKAIVDTLLAEHVTATFAPTPLWIPVLDEIERRGGIDHQLKRVVIFFGNAETLERTTKVIGPVWAHGFGSTEQGAVTTRLLPSDVEGHPERLHSVGRPGSPFYETSIKDPDGNTLAPGETGEICVRSAMSSSSYWNLPDETRQAFFPGDWFRPGDVGYLDTDGYLYYSDRAGDTLVTAHGAIYPHLIEGAISRHPAVLNSGVVGLGPKGQQVCVAAIQLKPGSRPGPDLAAEILQAITPHLAKHQVPQRIEFIAKLPTVLGGAKVQRAEVRRMLDKR